MIIDTNGFEIGNTIWYVWYGDIGYCPKSETIYGFEITEKNIRIISKYNHNYFNIRDTIYKSQSDCQLECDRLNDVDHDLHKRIKRANDKNREL